MGKTIVNEIEKCTQCPHCTILPDPDPYDWFCDDDVKLFCEKLKRTVAATKVTKLIFPVIVLWNKI